MGTKALAWSGLKGGKIGIGFHDTHFGLQQMETEIDLAGQAYPNLPDEVPSGTRFVFGKDGTGHLTARPGSRWVRRYTEVGVKATCAGYGTPWA